MSRIKDITPEVVAAYIASGERVDPGYARRFCKKYPNLETLLRPISRIMTCGRQTKASENEFYGISLMTADIVIDLLERSNPPLGVYLDWVIQGCGSGFNRRPFDINWARKTRNQCASVEIPYFLKQIEIGGKVVHMPKLDGVVYAQRPEVIHGL